MGDMADDAEMHYLSMLFDRGLRSRRRSAREDFRQPAEETTNMKIRETAQAQLQRNEAERQRLLTRLAMLDAFGEEDPWEDQTTLSFERSFNGPRTYTHVAVRLGGVWYVTGSRNTGRSFTWTELVEEHLSKALPDSIYVATEWMAYDET